MTSRPFGGYELLERLAVGGASELWIAIPQQHGGRAQPLLLKRLLPHLADEPEAAELFLQEAKLGADLQHPNIVRILDSGVVQGTPYLAREFILGEALNRVQRLTQRSSSALTHERALHIITSVCAALVSAYHTVDSRGRPLERIHGELVARHVLISIDGVVKVIGFGGHQVADLERRQPVRAGLIPGRFDGMAPEQLRGEGVDHRTDLFTTGLMLYELLTGVRPLKRDSEMETLMAISKCEIAPPSQVAPVPQALDALVMKALARAPDDRYQDAREFQQALEAVLSAQGAKPGPESLMELMRRLSGGNGPS